MRIRCITGASRGFVALIAVQALSTGFVDKPAGTA